MPWNNPKVDWDTNPVNPTSTDFNRIEGNIDFLNIDIETKKGAIVDALNGVGIATTLTDTHAQIASKIVGAEKTDVSITPNTVNQTIPNGIYDIGAGVVSGDSDLVSANIKSGKQIFGVGGSVVEATGTALVGDVLAAKTFSKAGSAGLIGTMPNYAGGYGTDSLTRSGTQLRLSIPNAGYYSDAAYVYYNEPDWIAANIKAGVSMFGVIGAIKEPVTGVATRGTSDLITVSQNFGFTPSQVIAWTMGTYTDIILYAVWNIIAPEHSWVEYNSFTKNATTYYYTLSSYGGYVNSMGFKLKVYGYNNTTWGWIALP